MRWGNGRMRSTTARQLARLSALERLFGSSRRMTVGRATTVVPSAEWSGPGYEQTLDQARDALRRGVLEEVEHVLMRAAVIAEGDPAYFNLVGLLHECRGRKRQARKAYGRAIAIDSNYAPSQQNMRRFYELTVFGCTNQPAALGDEPEFSSLEL